MKGDETARNEYNLINTLPILRICGVVIWDEMMRSYNESGHSLRQLTVLPRIIPSQIKK
jgi:hypothetical protein